MSALPAIPTIGTAAAIGAHVETMTRAMVALIDMGQSLEQVRRHTNQAERAAHTRRLEKAVSQGWCV